MLYLFPGEINLVTENRHIWKKWADVLHRWGMQEMAATMLEAIGPLKFIGAQAVYISQPILDTIMPKDTITAIANLLDKPEEAEAFTTFLRQHQGID
jgi:hypothetical protein